MKGRARASGRPAVDGGVPMQRWARARAAERLDRLESEIERAAASHDPDAVHDLRVSIRRFGACLRVLAAFFPGGARRKVRKRLRGVMDLAAAVRDRDIALDLMAQAGLAGGDELRRERDEAAGALLAKVERWRDKRKTARWRKELGL